MLKDLLKNKNTKKELSYEQELAIIKKFNKDGCNAFHQYPPYKRELILNILDKNRRNDDDLNNLYYELYNIDDGLRKETNNFNNRYHDWYQNKNSVCVDIEYDTEITINFFTDEEVLVSYMLTKEEYEEFMDEFFDIIYNLADEKDFYGEPIFKYYTFKKYVVPSIDKSLLTIRS